MVPIAGYERRQKVPATRAGTGGLGEPDSLEELGW
jgi:hypothetical protein